MAMIYRAPWKPHECPTGELSIPEVLPYLCDENKIVPTQISSLYAFLTLTPTLDVHSAPGPCASSVRRSLSVVRRSLSVMRRSFRHAQMADSTEMVK